MNKTNTTMKIANVYGIIKECRERIIKTMQERGMESIVFSPCKEDYEREHENDEEYVEWYDYLNDVCPNVVFFDKYNMGYEYTVLRVTLMGDQMEPYFTLDCYNSELGKAAFTSHHIYDMTPVYELLEKKLDIEDEPEKVYVFTAEQAWEGESADIIVKTFRTKEAAQKFMHKFIHEDGDESIEDYVKRKGWEGEMDEPDLYRAYYDGRYTTDHIEITITECNIE